MSIAGGVPKELVIQNIRKSIVRMAHYSKASHVGSSLSTVEILYTLYFQVMNVQPADPKRPDRDRFILSKAHASTALYSTLAERGFFPKALLDRYYIDGGVLPGHLDMRTAPGVEFSGGSLGHGLPIGLGMAVANRLAKLHNRVFVLVGDGECNEGSVMEAAMLAPTQKLNNLVVIVDFNNLQSFGRTNEVIDQSNISGIWRAMGWEVIEVDGHDVDQLDGALTKPQKRPRFIVAHTVKGKGVSFMEDRLEWHYKSPNDEQALQAFKELGG
jgi:transketolase